MFFIHKTKRYQKEEKKFRLDLGDEVFNEMEKNLSVYPYFGKCWNKLKGNEEPPYRYKIADYRVFYWINQRDEAILLDHIKARKDSYKKR